MMMMNGNSSYSAIPYLSSAELEIPKGTLGGMLDIYI